MQKKITLLGLSILLLLTACGKKQDDTAVKKPTLPLITVTQTEKTNLEIREQSIGTIEGIIDPTIAAEVAGRVTKVFTRPGESVRQGQSLIVIDPTDLNLQKVEAQAELSRIEALLANQEKVVERNLTLLKKNFISQNALDDVTTQKTALERQLEGAKAKIAIIDHNRTKTHVIAPVDGKVEKLIVAVGEYVKVGDPLMQIISRQKLRANLPVPESIALEVKVGTKVRLSTPAAKDPQLVQVNELKPLINTDSRALNAVADIQPDIGWQPGASVTGIIILGERNDAIMVPEQSVVLRPAGEVVYIIEGGEAHQRLVKTGLLQDGKIEIQEGLQGGETIAVDGAALLTDKAKINIKTNRKS